MKSVIADLYGKEISVEKSEMRREKKVCSDRPPWLELRAERSHCNNGNIDEIASYVNATVGGSPHFRCRSSFPVREWTCMEPNGRIAHSPSLALRSSSSSKGFVFTILPRSKKSASRLPNRSRSANAGTTASERSRSDI